MHPSEAYKILDVSTESSWAEAYDKFQKQFKLNDPQNGGSFYVQSKIVRAIEAIQRQKNI